MKIISIGSDRNLFNEGSAVRTRIVEYGELVEEMHIVTFNQKSKLEKQNFGNIYLYPTNSRNRWFYVFDAVKIGREIIKNFQPKADQPRAEKSQIKNSRDNILVSSQDPFECGLAGYFIAKKFKIPLQIQIHTDFLNRYFWKESLLNKIRTRLAKFLIPRAGCIRVVSDRIKKSLISSFEIHASRIVVLPIFVDVRKIQEAEIKTDLRQKYPQFDFIILMVSRFTKEKNIGLAIETITKIVKKYPKTGLIIAGDGPEREKLKLQITNCKLQKNVILEPWTDDLESYYKTADLFLLTSNYEGYGMAVVEAMAAGCSVVMTDVGLAGEILKNGENGFVIPVSDKQGLERAILELIDNRKLSQKFIQKSKEIIACFSSKEKYLRNYYESWRICRQ